MFRDSPIWPGISFAIAAAITFGVSTPLAKYLLGSIDPLALAGLLYLGSGVGLTLLVGLRKLPAATSKEAGLKRQDIPWLIGMILFGGILGPILLLFGLTTSDAAAASLLLNLEVVFTLLIAWIVFREHVDYKLFVGAFAIFSGAALLSWQDQIGTINWGAILIALACLSWAIDNNLTRKISATDPYVLAAVKGLSAGTVNTVLAFWTSAKWPELFNIIAALSLGFVSYGLGLVLFIYALRHLGTARTGAYYGTAPFIGSLVAAIFFGSEITPLILAAGLLMAIGAWLHLAEHHVHEHTHAELDHDHIHSHDEHHQHGHSGDVVEPHSHVHRHTNLKHTHRHYPDLHHGHNH